MNNENAARLTAIAERIREEIGNFERNRAYPTSAPFVDRIAPIIAAALAEAEVPLLAQIDIMRQEQDIAEKFHAVAVGERNLAWTQLQRAEQHRDTALAALKQYGQHTEDCPREFWLWHRAEAIPEADYPCTCGLDAALLPDNK